MLSVFVLTASVTKLDASAPLTGGCVWLLSAKTWSQSCVVVLVTLPSSSKTPVTLGVTRSSSCSTRGRNRHLDWRSGPAPLREEAGRGRETILVMVYRPVERCSGQQRAGGGGAPDGCCPGSRRTRSRRRREESTPDGYRRSVSHVSSGLRLLVYWQSRREPGLRVWA